MRSLAQSAYTPSRAAPAPSQRVAECIAKIAGRLTGQLVANGAPRAPEPTIALDPCPPSQGLVGRIAEMYWPADGQWYLIRVQSVNLEARTADILYNTGEAESVSLDDVVGEGHLFLHSS